MGNVKFTQQQQDAVNTRNCDILVSAAAGSGKTAVLVQRIISMITDTSNPIDIDTLLVVTFTKAAAAEMRQRIFNAVSEKLENEPENLNLQKQLTLLNKASITTIDSFCSTIVRKYFHLIDIDPNFKIADSTECELIKMYVIDEYFQELYEENNTEFINLVESYCLKTNDDELINLILEIHNFIQSKPYPEKWLKECIEYFNLKDDDDIYDTKWLKIIEEQVKIELNSLSDSLKNGYKIINNKNGFAEGYLNALNEDKIIIDQLISASEKGMNELYNFFSKEIKFERLKTNKKKDTLSEENKQKIKTIHSEIKNTISDLKNKIFSKSAQDLKDTIIKIYPIIKTLGNVIIEFNRRFQNTKKEKMLVDFSDLEHFCIDILIDENGNPTKPALEIQEKYNEIIIDEYQDSNYVQELILSSISRMKTSIPNRFMVGDIKQCIYKFRLANPEIFMEKYNKYKNSDNIYEKRIDLSKNFRSRKCILDAVNFLFFQLMTSDISEIEYDKESALYEGNKFPDIDEQSKYNISDSSEFYIIDSTEIENNTNDEFDDIYDEINELKDAELEASFVADKIKKIINTEKTAIYDKDLKKYRPVEFKDIVILLRSTKTTAEIFAETLMTNGISAFASNSSGYFESIEIMTILSFLQIIDNPRQDIHLITVLHSPIYSFSWDELTEIKTCCDFKNFYDCIKYYISSENKDIDDKIVSKIIKFLSDLKKWKKMSVFASVNELLFSIYNETNYFNYVGILTGGSIRQANLNSLLEKSIQFEKTSFNGLFQFIKYIERIKESKNNDFGNAKIFSENENVVKILSVHKSKGLEFPIVFVCMLGKKINTQDSTKNFLIHQELGFGPKYVDFEMRTQIDSIAKYAISKKITKETLSEELRILYVALTRAQEKLILVGTSKKVNEKLLKWGKFINLKQTKLPAYLILKPYSILDWIIPAISRHKDASVLRREYDYIENIYCNELYNHESKWKVDIISRNDIIIEKKQEKEKYYKLFNDLNNLDISKNYSTHKNEIDARLSWQYSHKLEQNLPSIVSISEIKRLYYLKQLPQHEETINTEIEFKPPEFIKIQRELTGSERGIAFHTVLEHINFKEIKNLNDLNLLIDNLYSRNILSEQEKNSINKTKIMKFLSSDIAQRIRNSNLIKRETPFVMGMTPYEIYEDEIYKDLKTTILVHGIIDLYFEENNKIILLDYKTDYVTKSNIEQIKSKYKVQINLYKKALEKNIKKEVSECVLYLFGIDSTVEY